jgi:tetratricopeptide (TPR) repeat protein
MMSSMRRGNRTEEMKEQERRKSDLLLRGRLAREISQHDEAARLFGEAAQLEEVLAAAYDTQGISEQVGRHRFSAAGCWSQAGNFLRALELCDALVEEADTPESLRERASGYARMLRERRDHMWTEILQAEPQPIPV